MLDVVLKLKGLPFGVAFETLLLEDVVFKPNRFEDGVLVTSLLGDTPLEPEKIPTVDEGVVDPNKPLPKGGWVDVLLPEIAEMEPNRLPPRRLGFVLRTKR